MIESKFIRSSQVCTFMCLKISSMNFSFKVKQVFWFHVCLANVGPTMYR